MGRFQSAVEKIPLNVKGSNYLVIQIWVAEKKCDYTLSANFPKLVDSNLYYFYSFI